METYENEILSQTELDQANNSLAPLGSKQTANPVLPFAIRYLIVGFLAFGISAAVIFAFIRQTSVKPSASNVNSENCADPITANRLRETLSKSPNDFSTLMEWGGYNLSCSQPHDYTSAIAAYQNAARLAENSANNISIENRLEAHLDLGLAYFYNTNFKEAQSEFKFVLKDNPNNSTTLFLMGAALSKDDPAQAVNYLKRVIEVSPNSAVADKAQALINDLSGVKAPPVSSSVTPKV